MCKEAIQLSILDSAGPKPNRQLRIQGAYSKNLIKKSGLGLSAVVLLVTDNKKRTVKFVIINDYEGTSYARYKERQNMKHVSCLIWGIIEESLFCLGSLKKKPVSLVLKFHENGDGSLTIYKAAENKKFGTKRME